MDGGHRAIIFNRLTGVKEGVMAEGMHFVVPWFEWPYIYDVRTKPRNVQVRGGGSMAAGALYVTPLECANIMLFHYFTPYPAPLWSRI